MGNNKLNQNSVEEMAAEKERILKYLEEQMEIKLDALKQYELPIKDMVDKSPSEMEAFLLRHEIYELKKHIAVIRIL
jgi:hypothetical protein